MTYRDAQVILDWRLAEHDAKTFSDVRKVADLTEHLKKMGVAV